MGDAELAIKIAAGDLAAVSAAYDKYARPLHAYCRSQLGDPADAAAAARDTFIVAALRLRGLRDPTRLRPWLYAVARNECRRVLRPQDRAAQPGGAAGTADDTADFGGSLDQAGFRELVRSAYAALDSADREVIQLTLRARLDTVDLSDALRVPRTKAAALAARAGDEFAAGVAALLAASSAQGSCRAVHAIVTSGDDLTAPLRRHVRRHMRHCARCAERGRRDLRPAVLAGLLPGTVLPSTLRQQVMDVLTGSSQQAAAARAVVTVRAEPFDRTGFPVLIEWLAAPRERPAHLPVAGALVAVFALFGGGGVYVASTLHHGPARSPAPAVPSVQAGPAGSAPAALPAVRRPAQRAGHAAIRPLLAATSQLSPSSTSAGPSRSAAQPTASSRGTSSPKPTSKASPTPSPSQASSPPPPIPTPTPTPSPSASLTVTQAPGPSLLVSLAGRLGL